MKQNINEIKRMQLIAGLITESEYRESQLTNEGDEDGLPLTPKLQKFIDKVVKDAKKDGEFEDLMDADYFEEDFIEFILEKFDTEGEYGDVSQEVKDYITKSTGSVNEDLESDLRGDLEKISGMKSGGGVDKAKVLKALFSNDERRVTRKQLDKILRQLDFQSAKEFEDAWKNAGLELDVAKPGEGYTVWDDNYAGQGDYIEFVNGKFSRVIRSGDE